MMNNESSTPLPFEPGGLAVIVGADGGIGSALAAAAQETGWFAEVIGLSRRSFPRVELGNEATIADAAEGIGRRREALRLVINASGFLHDAEFRPEKSWREIEPGHLARAFAVNATGPAVLMKHFLPLLARSGKAVFANLSARVGSIGDNRLGGWHSYRASKAAGNMLVRGCAIELRRRASAAICVALHPGTVDTRLSKPFAKAGLELRSPATAARDLLAVISSLRAEDNGGFFDHRGHPVPW